MPLIKRTAFQHLVGVGRESEPKLTIRDSGQIGLSTAVADKLNILGDGKTRAAAQWNPKARKLALTMFNEGDGLPKGVAFDDLFKVSKGQKGGSCYLAGVIILQYGDAGKPIGYSYKESGTQKFDVTVDEDKRAVTVTIPEGALTPPPKRTRKKKEPPAQQAGGEAQPAAAPAPAQATEGQAMGGLSLEEPE